MAQQTSPEVKSIMIRVAILSGLITLMLAAIAVATFVFGVIERPIGVVLIVVLAGLDAWIVVPAVLKLSRLQEEYNGTHGGGDDASR